MASNSSVGPMICVVWNTKVPQQFHEKSSKSFKLMGSECVLQLKSDHYYGNSSLSIKSVGGSIQTLHVTAFLRYLNSDRNTFPSCHKTIGSTNQVIWTSNSNALAPTKDCEFLCLFRPAVSSHSNLVGNETIQILTDYPPPSQPALKAAIGFTSLSADFSKLLKDNDYPDVTLKCGDRTMSAHRVVLAARSTVFAAMFRNKMAEREAGVVDMIDMEPQILELFLKYVYSGRIPNLTKDNVSSLFSIGDKYAVSSLQKECSAWILQHLTSENCLVFLVLADAHSDQVLKDELVKFIVKNIEVLKGKAWSKLMEEHSKLAVYVYHRCFAEKLFKDN